MEKHTLKASVRKIFGRKTNQLRKEGFLPGNVFGKKIKSLAVTVKADDLKAVYDKVGETGLISLEIGEEKESRPVLISSLQKNPVTDSYLHVDFHQVDLKEKVEADVEVEIINESPVEKQNLGTVVQYLKEIKVEALPADLPEKFIVDAAKLTEVEQAILVKDLNFDKNKVEIKADLEEIVVKVEPPQKIVEEPVAAQVPAEGEASTEGAVSSETPVEGVSEGNEKAEPPKEEEKA